MKKTSSLPKKFKWVIQALILSGILNALLILIFFYFILKDKPITSSFEYKPIASSVSQRFSEPVFNSQVIRTFQSMPYEQLIEKLTQTQLVEDGFAQRDLAVACLVKDHYFDLKKALNGKMVQERELFYQIGLEKKTIAIFAGLTDFDYQTILQFVQKEKWPLTTQGLFYHLKKGQKDSSLTQAFCQTPEFLAVETLFGRAGIPIKKRILLNLICEGSWESIAQFAQSQKSIQDFSPARRQCFLVDYVGQNSRTAAYLIIMTDRLYAAKRLDDAQICHLLELLNEKTAESVLFAKELLAGPRSDKVHQLSAKRLYEYAAEPIPETFDRKIALAKFCPEDVARQKQNTDERASQKIAQEQMLQTLPKEFAFSKETEGSANKETAKNIGVGNLRPKFRDKPPASPPPKLHVVQEGESLWMISRKYKIDVESLMRYNSLSSNLIKPGKTLKIPPVLNP